MSLWSKRKAERERLESQRREAESAVAQTEREKIAGEAFKKIVNDAVEWHQRVQLENHFAEKLRLAYGK